MLGTQFHANPKRPSQELFKPVFHDKQTNNNKPKGGLWTSTHTPDDTYPSQWIEWGVVDGGNFWLKMDWWLLTPDPNARIITIDSYEDLEVLQARYPLQQEGIWEDLPLLDFTKIAQDYDAMNLTGRGQIKTRLTYPLSLYGWDCESTLWFRWLFTDVSPLWRTIVKIDVLQAMAERAGEDAR